MQVPPRNGDDCHHPHKDASPVSAPRPVSTADCGQNDAIRNRPFEARIVGDPMKKEAVHPGDVREKIGAADLSDPELNTDIWEHGS